MRTRLAACLIAALPAPALAERCPAPAGWRAVAERHPRFVVFGELHGTAQSPRLVGDVACHLAQRHRRVLLAIEMQAMSDAALQRAWVGPHARFEQSLVTGPMDWAMRPGGVASRDWFAMLLRLHALKSAGAPIDVVAFAGPRGEADWDSVKALPGQNPIEALYARNVLHAAARRRYDAVLVLVGSLHARRAPQRLNGVTVEPMAMRLGGGTLSLELAWSGGTAWNCVDKPGTPTGRPITAADLDCSPHDTGRWPIPSGPRRIILAAQLPPHVEVAKGIDGVAFVGPLTPSPPVEP